MVYHAVAVQVFGKVRAPLSKSGQQAQEVGIVDDPIAGNVARPESEVLCNLIAEEHCGALTEPASNRCA